MTDTKVGYRGGYEQKEREGEMKELKKPTIPECLELLEQMGINWSDMMTRYPGAIEQKKIDILTEIKGIVEKYPIAVKLIDQLKATPKVDLSETRTLNDDDDLVENIMQIIKKCFANVPHAWQDVSRETLVKEIRKLLQGEK